MIERLRQKVGRRLGWYRARLQINNPFVGRIVELLGNTVRMDGLRYSVASPNISRGHKSTLFFGLHEMEERNLVKAWLPRDLPVVELGGGLGVVSCLTNKQMRYPDKHVVVEANPYMTAILERNRDSNACRFEVINRAIAYGSDTVDLPIDPEFVGTNLSAVGKVSETVSVATTTITQVADDHDFDRFALVADIEGVEKDIIGGEIAKLGERLRFAMFELHPYVYGLAEARALMRAMEKMGFRLLQQTPEGDVFCVAYGRDD